MPKRHATSQLDTANVVHNWGILSNLKMEATRSSKTSVLATATQHHNPESVVFPVKHEMSFHIAGDGIFNSNRRENLKSSKVFGLIWSGSAYKLVAGFCEHGDGLSGFMIELDTLTTRAIINTNSLTN
jgi:hypothetical protein